MAGEEGILAAILGLACGDALGAPAEFKTQVEVRRRWGTLTDMVGGGCWEPGEWTDDTGMALCVAEGILADPENPVPEAGRRFLEWRRTAKDVGTTIRAVLSGFRGDWAEAARNAPQARQGKAAGNGSLMRTLPVALAYAEEREMLRASARLSAMTHWDAQAEACCAIYCLWVRALLEGRDRADAWRAALAAGRSLAPNAPPTAETPGMDSLPTGFWERLKAVEERSYDALQPSGYAGYVLECLEAAAWCVLKTDSLEDCLVKAVNLGGEADTIAAVAGGAAGAFWGPDALPARWLAAMHQSERLTETARRLARLRRHQEVYTQGGLRGKPFRYDRLGERLLTGRHPLTAWDVETLAGLGVTHVLDLREAREWDAPGKCGWEALDALAERGLTRRHVTVGGMRPPTPEAFDAAWALFQAVEADPAATLYVHCRAGRERTGAVVTACLARREGVSFDAMLARLNAEGDVFWPMRDQAQAARAWLEAHR